MKKRLDILLVERGLCDSRSRAQALLMEGKVRVRGQVERRASRQVEADAELELEEPPRFVSRGGEKLEGAFAAFPGLSADGKTCLDVGSSTGGFTDCLLQHGARRVMAVDVGTNQLAWSLRNDPRVWVRENFNARFMKAEDIPEVPSLAVTDVSFISLKLILPPIRDVLAPDGEVVALIKPQFEVGRGNAPGGLVRDERLRSEARDEIVRFAREELGFELLGLAESPIRGREKGNVEYLSHWRKGAAKAKTSLFRSVCLFALQALACSAMAADSDPFVRFADIPSAEALPRSASLTVADDGTFLVDGRPRYLTATIFYGGTDERHIHTSGYPADLNWLYEEIPDFEGMQRLGVDAVGFEGGREWMRLVSPTAAPKWKMSGCFPADARFSAVSEGQLPMYVDLTPAPWGHGGIVAKDNPQLPPEAWTAGDNHWVPYSIHHPDGRGIWLKMWRETAERYSKLPTKPYCYELMNEPSVHDNGPYAKGVFAKSGCRDHPVEFLKFTDEAFASLIAEGVEAIHGIQPGARVTLQPVVIAAKGVDLYRLSRILDLVCTPTGGGGIPVAHMMRALADGKPIVDGETYIGSTESSARNALLCQFARGYNASYTFKWSRRPRDWARGGDAAAEAPVAKGVSGYNFLNPYAVPTESLVGLRLAKRDALDVAEFFVPRDRGVPRRIAVLYSKATERAGHAGRGASTALFDKVVDELEYAHLCPDVIFEEQLTEEPERLSRYRMLVAPGVSSVFPGTPAALRAWQAKGGRLVLVGERMSRDEYGAPNCEEYPGSDFVEAEGTSAQELSRALSSIAAKCGVAPTCENPGAERIEAICARRGGMSAWYLASRAVGPQVVRWRPAERSAFAVSVRNVRRADGTVVSRRRKLLADAEGYFVFFLKPSDAELIVFGSDDEIARRYPNSSDAEWLPPLGAAEASAEAARKMEEHRLSRMAKTGGYHIDANRTRQLDLRRIANVGVLTDSWWGMKEIEGVPFEFIRTDQNFFRDAVKLAPDSSPAVVGVDDEVLHLYFNYSGRPVFTAEYADGGRVSFKAPQGIASSRRVWRWTSPRPGARIKRIAFAARGGEALVAAVTVERPAPGTRAVSADEIAGVKSRSGASIAPELKDGVIRLVHGDVPAHWSCALVTFKDPIPVPPGKCRLVFEVNRLPNRYGKDAASPGLQVNVAISGKSASGKPRSNFKTPISDDGIMEFRKADDDPGTWETLSVPLDVGGVQDAAISAITFQYKRLPCADPAALAVANLRLEPVAAR